MFKTHSNQCTLMYTHVVNLSTDILETDTMVNKDKDFQNRESHI